VETTQNKTNIMILINLFYVFIVVVCVCLLVASAEATVNYFYDLAFEYDEAWWTQVLPVFYYVAMVSILADFAWRKVNTIRRLKQQ
jgi:hypothetical protein